MNKNKIENYNIATKEKLRKRGFKMSTYEEYEQFLKNRSPIHENRSRKCRVCQQPYDRLHYYILPNPATINITTSSFCSTTRFSSCLFCRCGFIYDEEKRTII